MKQLVLISKVSNIVCLPNGLQNFCTMYKEVEWETSGLEF